jgi:hypothetical protein
LVKSQRKGGNFERETVQLLNRYLKPAVWHRTPRSGGFCSQGVTDDRFKGDVFTEDPTYSGVLIECKTTGTTLSLRSLFTEDGKLADWWAQTINECGDKTPFLIFRYYMSPVFVVSKTQRHFFLDALPLNKNPLIWNGRFIFLVEEVEENEKVIEDNRSIQEPQPVSVATPG